MQLIQSLLASAAVLAAAVVADYETEESVLVLGEDNLAEAVKEFPILLVEFYAPWCGHCKQLAPEYAIAAQKLSDIEGVRLAKVDATVHTKVAADYDVSGYPTIKFFNNGEVSDFNGGRTADEIVAWVQKKSGPSVTVVSDVDTFKNLKEANPIIVVLFTTDGSEESKLKKHFTKFADTKDDIPCVIINEAAVAKELEIEVDGSVVLFKQYDEGRVNFDGEKITKTNLEAFIKPHLLPHVVEFSNTIVERLFGGDIKEHMLYFRKDADSDADKAIMAEYREVAKAHQGELIFVAVNMDIESNSRIADFFGLTDSNYPAVRVININSQPIKYLPPEGFELNQAGFELFASKYIAADLTPSRNSEDVPEDWDAEEVKVLVGVNFKEVALDDAKNVLIVAHAPWCGHCKAIMPVIEELAEHFEDDDKVVIAKMDATKNEVEEMTIDSFPTIKFFPSGNSEMFDYEGGRTLEDFISYIEQNRGDAAPPAAGEENEDAVEDKDEL